MIKKSSKIKKKSEGYILQITAVGKQGKVKEE